MGRSGARGLREPSEAQFLERGELSHSRGGFTLRADAIAWAEVERKALE